VELIEDIRGNGRQRNGRESVHGKTNLPERPHSGIFQVSHAAPVPEFHHVAVIVDARVAADAWHDAVPVRL
jgi:hypothetical protein